jgi:prepilin-type processing-associated H-X9-DG protein
MDQAASPPPSPLKQPFQFTLRQLTIAVLTLSAFLALTVQLGGFGFWIAITGFSAVATCYGLQGGRPLWLGSGIFGLVVSLWLFMLSALVHPRESARKMTCSNNLHNITLALQQYHDIHGSFPPAYIADANGKPMHSWRVLILPYLEQKVLYQQYRFDEPWDGPNNRKLHGTALKIYVCPAGPENQPKTDTDYVVVVGTQTMWPGVGITRNADVKDGLSNTILLTEAYNSGIHWMEPRDLHVTQMPMAINPQQGQGISSAHKGGAEVSFADGSVRFLESTLPSETLRAMLTITGGEKVKQP